MFGNECNGHVRGVGFGPTPSIHPTKNTSTIAQERSQEMDAEVRRQEMDAEVRSQEMDAEVT